MQRGGHRGGDGFDQLRRAAEARRVCRAGAAAAGSYYSLSLMLLLLLLLVVVVVASLSLMLVVVLLLVLLFLLFLLFLFVLFCSSCSSCSSCGFCLSHSSCLIHLVVSNLSFSTRTPHPFFCQPSHSVPLSFCRTKRWQSCSSSSSSKMWKGTVQWCVPTCPESVHVPRQALAKAFR